MKKLTLFLLSIILLLPSFSKAQSHDGVYVLKNSVTGTVHQVYDPTIRMAAKGTSASIPIYITDDGSSFFTPSSTFTGIYNYIIAQWSNVLYTSGSSINIHLTTFDEAATSDGITLMYTDIATQPSSAVGYGPSVVPDVPQGIRNADKKPICNRNSLN